jgi:two-component system, chemotaxis family, protein-glutamate methylesterase/glutaminase
MPNHDIVAIGGSAGSFSVLREIVAEFPADIPAAVLVVFHVGPGPSILPSLLNESGKLPARFAQDGERAEKGRIYVAPPDRHLLVEDGLIVVRRGPRENSCRPAIDPLFRSVAAWYGPRVVGVVLSGALSDGAAGLVAIKRCGGLAVVQDPADADHPSMPQSAIEAADVDFIKPSLSIGQLIVRLVREPAASRSIVPDDIREEVDVAAHGVMAPYEATAPIEHDVPVFSCPDCGGPLSLVDDKVVRFRCAVGHAHTVDTLLASKSKEVEQALWVAFRTNRERAAVLRKMARDSEARDQHKAAEMWEQRAAEFEHHAKVIHELLISSGRADVRVPAETA